LARRRSPGGGKRGDIETRLKNTLSDEKGDVATYHTRVRKNNEIHEEGGTSVAIRYGREKEKKKPENQTRLPPRDEMGVRTKGYYPFTGEEEKESNPPCRRKKGMRESRRKLSQYIVLVTGASL